jgi:hypothetical protein
MAFDKNITALIQNSIPRFVRIEYPKFTEFITVYYSLQEAPGQSYEFLANMLSYANIDETTLSFLENFSGTFLSDFPVDNLQSGLNKRTLVKHIREFYQSAGTENSVKFLFRLLFNEDVSIYYPTNDILRVSDGKWQNDYVIKVSNSRLNDDIKELEGSEIRGLTSKAKALVEKVKTYVASNSFYVAEIYLRDIDPLFPISSFVPGEYISGTSIEDNLFSERIYHILVGTEIVSPGLFNSPGDLVIIQSNIGVDGFVVVNDVEKGSIEDIEILDGGSGYALNEIITFSSSSGRRAKAKITGVDGSGAITTVNVTNQGYDYKELPVVNISTAGGSGAILYPVSSSIGKIKNFKIINFGVNYNPNESETFPYQFPINFSSITGQVLTYRTMFYYDESSSFVNNEVIQGVTSGATGNIRRVNGNNVLAYLLTSSNDFTEGEQILGLTSSCTAYVHKRFSSVLSIIPGAVGNYSGYYRNNDGFISSDKYIQDSYYYQDFSYVLNTLRNREQWVNVLKDTVHPSGTIVFGFDEGVKLINNPGDVTNFIAPLWSTVEHYKYNYENQSISDDEISDYDYYGSTQIKDFKDIPFYYCAWLNPLDYVNDPDGMPLNSLRKTNHCFGSYRKNDTGEFYLLIDEMNLLLIDSENSLIS